MPEPTRFQEQLSQLGRNTRRAVMQTYHSMMSAGMSADDVISVLVPVMYRAAREGETLARAELARVLARMTGTGITDNLSGDDTPLLDRERIESALTTTLADADGDSRATRLERLAYSDPLTVAQSALIAGMSAAAIVVGYRRTLNSNACELCEDLAAGGAIYPSDQPMDQHPGCLCSATPVLKTITN